ncbi:hypothetical protein SAMN02745148_02388 [Modicisalibacter ilicicola DSM 19980]|uniref:Secreted protein n=1 Tax=Modicisalibacter ilicicola DSM 19980 TaxID=1121942 RepID=A0A1M5AZ00_9GAMM|nr:hypothetical protein [Halomonas ilicicola]SHF35132.1 hypothetical protein SAMN02745148_02388 [Halomonas ilicicola DSM 19980]
MYHDSPPTIRLPSRHHLAFIALTLLLAGLLPASASADEAPAGHLAEYPTTERVDYVLGCMAANGQDYLTMQKCSCSIDVIAGLMPFDEYEAVKTVLSMQDQRGETGVLFRTERSMQDRVRAFRSAQTEADLRCF